MVFALQPWRVCPEDDAPAGCVALPHDTAVMMIGIGLFLFGILTLVIGRSVRTGGASQP